MAIQMNCILEWCRNGFPATYKMPFSLFFVALVRSQTFQNILYFAFCVCSQIYSIFVLAIFEESQAIEQSFKWFLYDEELLTNVYLMYYHLYYYYCYAMSISVNSQVV